MKSIQLWIFLATIFLLHGTLSAQQNFHESFLINAELFVDTMEFSWEKHTTVVNGKERLAFQYQEDNEVAEVYIFFEEDAPVEQVRVLPSGDFSIIDSLLFFSDYARFKVRFSDLTNSEFLRFTFELRIDSLTAHLVELPLFPYTQTYAALYPSTEEMYIGEEKIFEVTTNNQKNIQVNNRWTEGLSINYKTTKSGGDLLLHLLPNELGGQQMEVNLNLKKPYLETGEFSYELPALTHTFNIKSGRLAFLQFDQAEITPKDDKKEPIEIQLDNSPFLKLNKTYRIEDQEESGGPLIAELYTKARLNNDKVLCLLRPYAFHRKSEGYLYIKEGDVPRFVANVDITPKTSIENLYIQREGKDWEQTNTVYPGETVNVKLEGEALHKANFTFPGANNLVYDSLIKNEQVSVFHLKIPLDVSANQIEIFNHNESTGKNLKIHEYQKPGEFNYLTLDLGSEQYVLSEVDKPIYYDETLTDLVFDFKRDLIDRPDDLNGKQYLSINVKVSNKRGSLIELYQFDELVICPSEASPRHAHYGDEDCQGDDINLNNFLRKKTSDLEEWSRIDIEVSHIRSKYGGSGKTRKVQIILRRAYNFDIDVSFPAGLLILKGGDNDFTNFGGVSFAMLAQFSFYQPGKVAKYRPYKIGAGFIAIDAFNFNANKDRQDVGLVVIGSIYPTSSDNKLTFPLFLGGGYLLKEQKPFLLIGPGIRVRI